MHICDICMGNLKKFWTILRETGYIYMQVCDMGMDNLKKFWTIFGFAGYIYLALDCRFKISEMVLC